MKFFLGVNRTHDKMNTQTDGEIFICERPTEAQTDLMDKSYETLTEIDKTAQLPRAVNLVRVFSGYAFLICAVVLIRSIESKEDFILLFEKSPWLLVVVVAAGILFWGLTWAARKKAKTIIESDESKMLIDRYDAAMQTALSALGVPPTAKTVDCFCSCYKIKKSGKIKILPMGAAQFSNVTLQAFTENGVLYIADPYQKYAVPLSEITAIKMINKRTTMNGWNKKTPFNKGEYKPFKIMRDNNGVYHLRQYYAMEILHNGEVYLLYFPPYELSVFTALTGLAAQEK